VSRWLVVGCDGMLGQDLVAALGESPSAHEVTAVDRDVLDIIDPDACLAFVPGHDFVVNVAAWTAVDDAETHEAQAFAVNAVGAANLARACSAAGARMLQVSTDDVFAGDATTPYAEDGCLGRVSGAQQLPLDSLPGYRLRRDARAGPVCCPGCG
jgi:dTDP-4-dehydrorhamnose reductase